MRIDEVPTQTRDQFDNQRKAVYAVDQNGHYQMVRSGGDEAEVTVTLEAVAWFEQLANDALQRVRSGESSPLEYFMYRQRMDIPTLSKATGMWQWRIRRHLRPKIFASLSATMLQRYADAMNISVQELTGPLDHAV